MDKYKRRRVIALFSAVFIIVLAVVLIKTGKSMASTDTSVLRNQKVDGLTFENATLEYKDGITTFTVDVYNETKKTYKLKNVDINFVQEDGQKITLLGYTGESLESDEGRKITASVDIDLTASTNIEYKINK